MWSDTIGVEQEMGANSAIEASIPAPSFGRGLKVARMEKAQDLIQQGAARTDGEEVGEVPSTPVQACVRRTHTSGAASCCAMHLSIDDPRRGTCSAPAVVL